MFYGFARVLQFKQTFNANFKVLMQKIFGNAAVTFGRFNAIRGQRGIGNQQKRAMRQLIGKTHHKNGRRFHINPNATGLV